MGLDELDAIAEGVGSKGAFHSLYWFRIVLHFAARGSQGFEQSREITDLKCWMRFLGGTKVRFDAEMKLQRATSKPGTTTSREIRRLGNFD